MDKKKLEMDFIDEVNKRFRLSIDDPKEDLEAIQVEAAMEEILTNNIFTSNGMDLVKYDAARIITTVVEEMEF
ncbi:MAG: DUF2922 domain-containing protein [Tissierellaceae bacterium]|jgi:hypothetical protein|nr:DUF2922 domain-containing protein [Tissierellia bacterium]